ncbi:MAG: hypothetical protein WAU41_07355 [Gaiellaceae bacterium]
MLPFLLALALAAPWTHPLAFSALPGWQTGTSGNTRSAYVGPGPHASVPLESTAWIARDVRYTDKATADPPNKTLAHLPARGIIVWAVIYAPASSGRPIQLDLRQARHLECCDGPVRVKGGMYELAGYGPRRAYSMIIRIYFGSRPTRSILEAAQLALNRLRAPAPA